MLVQLGQVAGRRRRAKRIEVFVLGGLLAFLRLLARPFFGGSFAGGSPAAVGGPNKGALLRLFVEPDFRRSSSASRSIRAFSFFSSLALRPMLSRSSICCYSRCRRVERMRPSPALLR